MHSLPYSPSPAVACHTCQLTIETSEIMFEDSAESQAYSVAKRPLGLSRKTALNLWLTESTSLAEY